MVTTVGYYAADGSMNVTGVSGSTYVGRYAADGSINIQVSPGGSQVGAYAPCGALYVTVAPTSPSRPLPYRALDGSLYIKQATGSGFNNAGVGVGLGIPVTVVGGVNPFGGSPAGSAYTGAISTRTIVPNEIIGGTATMSRRWHFSRESVTSLRLVIPNFYVNGSNVETVTPGTTAITASIEYPAATFTQVLFSGIATASVTAGFVISDPVSVTIPDGATFYTRIYRTNAGGLPDTVWTTAIGISSGDNYNYTTATDQTMSGTITNTGGWAGATHFGPAAVIATTTKPTVAIIGSSSTAGIGDVYDSSGDLGTIARSVGPTYGYVNGSVGGDTATAYTASHAIRQALFNYCSHAVIQVGPNDITNGRSSAQLIADRQTIAGYFFGRPTFETTLSAWTSSSDSWATTGNQTAIANPSVRQTFNTAVRAGTAGMAGFFDISSITDTSLSSGLWKSDGTAFKWTPDGIHPTQFANLQIKTSGIVALSSIVLPAGSSNQASTFLARTSGLNAAHQTNYKNLINGLLTDEILWKFDALWVPATADSTTAKLNLMNTSFALIEQGSPAFQVDRGYTGVDASTTVYLDTQINLSTYGGQFLDTSGHVSAWSNTNFQATALGGRILGVSTATIANNVTTIVPWYSDGNGYFRTNDGTPSSGTAHGTSLGHYVGNRSSGSLSQGYINGALFSSPNQGSGTRPNINLTLLANNDSVGPTISRGAGLQLSAASVGATLTSAEVTKFYNNLRTYMTAVGVT